MDLVTLVFDSVHGGHDLLCPGASFQASHSKKLELQSAKKSKHESIQTNPDYGHWSAWLFQLPLLS